MSSFSQLTKTIVYQKKFYKIREERLNSITFGKQKLLKLIIIYPEEKDNNFGKTKRILGTENSLYLLHNENVTQYFIGETYKCVTLSIIVSQSVNNNDSL